tara:strand:- start:285 stop:740 length:456 start_codon:yes stop_codon:yes gene_type:complete
MTDDSKYPKSDFENSVASEDEEDEDLELSHEFQESVVKYVKLDDLVRKKMDEIKELKKIRKPCEEFILSYLDDVKVSKVEITDGSLKRQKTETKVPINNKIIKTALEKKIDNPKVVNDIIKLVEEREKKVKVSLKRVKRKLPVSKNEGNSK